MRRRAQNNTGSEWDRIRQIIKVEEPVTIMQVHRFCRFDLKPWDVERVMLDMLAVGRLERHNCGRREMFTIK